MSNFYLDTICSDSRFHSMERIDDLALLEPVTRQSVQDILTQAAAMGIPVMVLETYRSRERQELLYSQGATQLEHDGTHHFGVAADIVKVVNGNPSWAGDFSFLRDLCDKNGLVSGLDWGQPGVKHKFVDPDHVQRVTLAQQPLLLSGAWYPDSTLPSDAITV